MSDKMPMYDVEKIRTSVQIKASTFVKLQRMCKAASLTMNILCGAILDDATKKVTLTEEEVEVVHEKVRKNILKRKADKAKKGIK